MPTVNDILRGRELYSVESSQSVAEVAEWMAELNIGAICVVDHDELCGVFSDRGACFRARTLELDRRVRASSAIGARNPLSAGATSPPEPAKPGIWGRPQARSGLPRPRAPASGGSLSFSADAPGFAS